MICDTVPSDDNFDLNDIVTNGELIMLTVGSPENYYDYQGRTLGVQYIMLQHFADKMGIRLRVELCRDTVEMVRKIIKDEADVMALQIDKRKVKGLTADSLKMLAECGARVDSAHTSWLASKEKPDLAKALDEWFTPQMLQKAKREEQQLLSAPHVHRRIFSPMINRKAGVISRYDALFITYSRPIRWDWRLMAAQCYQESTFDPRATSWAGAKGLMQIMPSTAEHLGLPQDKLFEPEANIAAAAKYLNELEERFSDVRNRNERTNFVLACYNGGYHHIRDAMALTRKYGGDEHSWNDVARYVLLLSAPKYYNDAVVNYGYMRGSETVDYVRRINARWQSYNGVKPPHIGSFAIKPRRATHERKKKYQ